MSFQFNKGKIVQTVIISILSVLLVAGVAQAAVTLDAGITSSGGLNVSAGNVSLPAASVADSALSSHVTLLGNIFNGASQLVKLDGTGKLPALDGSALFNLPSSSFDGAFSSLSGKPTTILGYGITDAFNGAYSALTGIPTFAPVATSGSYTDLTNKPTIFSGNYSALIGAPTLATVATSGNYNDLSNIPIFAPVATSGSYTDLANKPTLFNGDYNSLSNRPTLFDGLFTSLSSTPTTLSGYGITDALNKTLASGTIFVGNGSNIATPVTMSGDATISNTGVVTVNSDLHAYAMFYGLTAGAGNLGSTDYAATIPVKTAAGTGRVPFPRNGSAVGIVRADDSSFTLPDVGTYEVTFHVHTTEPGQLELEVNGVEEPECTGEDMNPTAGGHSIVGSCIITTAGVNAVIDVINPPGNSTALTITPHDGANTHANSQTLIIKKL